MEGTRPGTLLLSAALILIAPLACAAGAKSASEPPYDWPRIPRRLQGKVGPGLRLVQNGEHRSPALPNIASIWGSFAEYDCFEINQPKVILLRGPGLPPEGVRSEPADPWSAGGGFRFFGLAPGEYHLSLSVPVGQSPPLMRCFQKDIPLTSNDVTVIVAEGESIEIFLVLEWNEYGPRWRHPINCSLPDRYGIDLHSTAIGATIPDYIFQNIPLGPPPDR